MADDYEYIWIFMAHGGNLPAGVFTSQEKAREYIKKHKLVGHLAKYPVDISVYDWAIKMGFLKTDKLPYKIARQGFTTGFLQHEHFETRHYEDDKE